MRYTYDVVVVGAGSGGLTAAVGLKKAGKNVLLIEKGAMGGECTNAGCIPSKALIHASRTFTGKDKGAKAMAYVQETVERVREEEAPKVFADMGITVVKGEAVFTSPHSLQVGGTDYSFTRAVIASGSLPRRVPVPDLKEDLLLTNETIFSLKDIPPQLLIVGSGPIGLELSQAFARLGSQVTIVTQANVLGDKEDKVLRPFLQEATTSLGIDVYTGATLEKVDGKIAHIASNSGNATVPFTHVLMAIGRVPQLPAGLESAGVRSTETGIVTDSQHRTTAKHIFAVGDVASAQKFTHVADDAAREVIARVLSRGLRSVRSNKPVPKVTYTTPELAQVGLSWEEAVAYYGEEKLHRLEVPFSALDRAVTDQAESGAAVVIATRLHGRVVGAHIAGVRAGEIVGYFSLAMTEKISLWRLQLHIFAYPTYSLLVKKVANQFLKTQLTTLRHDIQALLFRTAPKIIAGLFWLTLVGSFQYYKVSQGLSYNDVLFQILDFFLLNAWAPALYILLYFLRPLILFPATLLTALSGALFGFWWGVVLTIIGENLSANFAYFIGRFFGGDLRLEHSPLGRFVTSLRDNAFKAVLFMRLFYVPFDLTNYGNGIIRTPWKPYALATLIGILPGLTTFVALGAAVDLDTIRTTGLTSEAFSVQYLLVAVVVFVVSLGLSRVLQRS